MTAMKTIKYEKKSLLERLAHITVITLWLNVGYGGRRVMTRGGDKN